MTLREALTVLRDQGLAETRRGGTFVRARTTDRPRTVPARSQKPTSPPTPNACWNCDRRCMTDVLAAVTTEYALTVAVPAVLDGTMVGVAAADVLVSSFEQRVLPALRALPRPMALANAAGRVVAANSPRQAPGLRVPVSGPGPWHLVPVQS